MRHLLLPWIYEFLSYLWSGLLLGSNIKLYKVYIDIIKGLTHIWFLHIFVYLSSTVLRKGHHFLDYTKDHLGYGCLHTCCSFWWKHFPWSTFDYFLFILQLSMSTSFPPRGCLWELYAESCSIILSHSLMVTFLLNFINIWNYFA